MILTYKRHELQQDFQQENKSMGRIGASSRKRTPKTGMLFFIDLIWGLFDREDIIYVTYNMLYVYNKNIRPLMNHNGNKTMKKYTNE